MKRLIPTLLVALLAARAPAQVITTLKSDSFHPGPLTLSDDVLYGFDYAPDITRRLFKMSTDGTGFTILKTYDPIDGFDPIVRPTVSGSTLFGVGRGRGILQQEPYNDSRGLVYRMNTDGTGYTVLKEFTLLADGSDEPTAALALSGSTLYGTMGAKIFKLNTNGTGFTVLRTFGPTTLDTVSGQWTNSDGVLLNPDLTQFGSTLYGTASSGGLFGYGTVFKLSTDGTGFTVLKHLILQQGDYASPLLTLAGETLYGASTTPWEWTGGAVWRVNTDGTGFMVVKKFSNAVWDSVSNTYTNSEGLNPLPGLAVWGNTLYGTTKGGGSFGTGTQFKVKTDGTGFTVIAHNSAGQGYSGAFTLQRLVLSGSTLYGAAEEGGDQGAGAIYRIDLVPALSIGRTGPNSLTVTWPSVWTDYVLQQNPNGLSSVNWSNVTTGIQNDGTNHSLVVNPTDTGRFYRLVSP